MNNILIIKETNTFFFQKVINLTIFFRIQVNKSNSSMEVFMNM